MRKAIPKPETERLVSEVETEINRLHANLERERERRTAVAAQMLAAILSRDSSTVVHMHRPQYARRAVEIADALIAALTPEAQTFALPPEVRE